MVVAYTFVEDDLIALSKSVGYVDRAFIIRDPETGKSRGYGYVMISTCICIAIHVPVCMDARVRVCLSVCLSVYLGMLSCAGTMRLVQLCVVLCAHVQVC